MGVWCFVEPAAEALLGSFLCLHSCLLISGISAAGSTKGFPWKVSGKACSTRAFPLVGAAAWGEFAVAGIANSRCVCMPTGCFAELYFSPVVGLSLMVDLNLACLLKGERLYKLPLSWFLFWFVGFFGFLLMIQNVCLDQCFSCGILLFLVFIAGFKNIFHT